MNTKLLPINTRITHFDGGEHTHGKGTIVAYNGVHENLDTLKRVLDGEVDKESKEVQAIVVSGVVAGCYSSRRYPYVVHFDPSEKYPEGYKDVYEEDSIRPLIE